MCNTSQLSATVCINVIFNGSQYLPVPLGCSLCSLPACTPAREPEPTSEATKERVITYGASPIHETAVERTVYLNTAPLIAERLLTSLDMAFGRVGGIAHAHELCEKRSYAYKLTTSTCVGVTECAIVLCLSAGRR